MDRPDAERVPTSATRRSFLAGARSTLREPLTGIIGYSEMLLEDVAVDGENALAVGLGRVHSEAEYLRAVAHVTDAAGAIEAGTFETESLAPVAEREDALGRLARVFRTMAREVYAREQRLKNQVAQLQIEIDQAKMAKQVSEITDTDYFRNLRQRARDLRKGGPQGGE